MSLSETDLNLIAAASGVVGTAIGLLLGASIQAAAAAVGRRRERLALTDYATELILNIKNIAAEYSEPKRVIAVVGMGIIFPKIVADELDILRESARKLSPTIAIEAMWLAQSCQNLEGAVKDLREEIKSKKDRSEVIREKHDRVLSVVACANGIQRFSDLLLSKIFFRSGLMANIRVLRHIGPTDLFRSYSRRNVK